ncbi:MAG TPA: serine/threonine-protein kinase [Thermoanaerobaculia bacterium]|jgi:serine/threonine-protein kinase
MLRFARASSDFLETPALSDRTTLAVFDDEPTRQQPATDPRRIDDTRFIPGDVVAGRYRIVGLLGRGGMGEVYRADDLKLAQPVALKFLAESLSSNGAALARFHREVSLSRQISHRHVCRVYDIGEHAGMHFLSMEYVRGEELSSLLKRIGRLPLDKALETARQLCAGLAAIHAAGVLHRDLKPANVMIDEHGDVRITDFGIAALAEGVSGREAMIGTPVYMSPEQLSGGELSVRSDIYALGLVLYETFTGKRPFAATTLPDIIRDRLGETTPTSPSDWIADLDPLAERVILRCLEKDPDRRPASALHVAAALPGGDPLAAALAAGETPSPQMVAAAQKEGGLRPLAAVLLLASIFLIFVAGALVSHRSSLHHYLGLELSRELLQARAVDIIREAGYTAPPADRASGFMADNELFIRLRDGQQTESWERFRAAPLPLLPYWYRQSPRPLVPYDVWEVRDFNPPNDSAGMVRLRLDLKGRLLFFEAVPPQDDAAPRGARPAPWARFFERAGLTMTAFRPADPRWTPPHHSDRRLAWTGVHPTRPELPLRVEAASYRGVPVWFQVIFPWQEADGALAEASLDMSRPFLMALICFYFAAIALAALLAWKNVRLGRGDRRGTWRLMAFVFVSRLIYWLFMFHHVAALGEIDAFVTALQSALYWSGVIGLLYMALEPFIRRRWPERLISWSRLLRGDLRDPLVGRDVLIGGALGVTADLSSNHLSALVPQLFGWTIRMPIPHSDLLYRHGLDGARGFVALVMNQTAAAIMFPLIMLSIVLFFAMLTRRNALGFAVTWLLVYLVLNLNSIDPSPVRYVMGLIFPTLIFFTLYRFGLLALMSLVFFNHVSVFYPVTTDLGAWYATSYLLHLALLTAIALYAFRVSLAGQKLMQRSLFDD